MINRTRGSSLPLTDMPRGTAVGLRRWLGMALSLPNATIAYAAVAGAVVMGVTVQNVHRQWSSDAWIHAAAVREMMGDPLSPQHPFLAEHLPHHSLSFYLWVVARIGAVSTHNVDSVLAFAGVVNMVAILVCFPYFVRAFSRRAWVVPLTLMLSLIAWGPGAWRYSGLLHVNAIGFSSPYPSAFATWVTFLGVALVSRWRHERLTPVRAVALSALGFVVANAHVITFGLLVGSVVALLAQDGWRRGRWGPLAAIAGGAVVGSWLWPFFDVFHLVANASKAVDIENQVFYSRPLTRISPALVGIVPMARLWRVDRRHPLCTASIIFATVYALGHVLDRVTLGRVLPFLVLMLHIALAGWLLERWRRARWRRVVAVCAAVGCVALAVPMAPGIIRMVPFALLPPSIASDQRLRTDWDRFRPIDRVTTDDDVVVAPHDMWSRIPAFGPKVALAGNMPYVTEQARWAPTADEIMARLEDPNGGLADVDWLVVSSTTVDVRDAARLGDVTTFGDVIAVRLAP